MRRIKLEYNREELFDTNMMISFSITLKGNLTRGQFEDAFDRAVSACEIFHKKIVIDPDGSAFYEDCDTPENGIYYTDLPAAELLSRQEKIRFRIEAGEFLRLFVDDSREGEPVLHFLMHHTAGDGRAFCFFTENYLNCLDGKTAVRLGMQLLGPEDIPKESRSCLLEACTGALSRRWKKEWRCFSFDESDRAFSAFWAQHTTRTEFTKTEKAQLDELLKKCRERNISLTAYCMAVLFRDLPGKRRIGFSMDIRSKGNRNMGNLSAGIPLDYRYRQKLDVWDNAARINRIFRRQMSVPKTKYLALNFMRKIPPTLVDALDLEYAGAFHSRTSGQLAKIVGYGKSRPLNDIGISNLGVWDIPEQYSSFRILAACIVPPNVTYARDVVGMITVGGNLYISRRKYI